MRSRALAALLLIGLTRTAIAQTDYHPLKVGKQPEKVKPKDGKLAAWTAKPGSAAQLDPERALFGWSIRPPRGFVSTQKADGMNQIYIFQGGSRPDNTSPVLWVITGNVQPRDNKRPSEETVLDLFMIQLHQNRDNWKVAPVQWGLLQGRRFVRCRWSASETAGGSPHHVRGTVYITLVGTKFAAITYQDADPGASSTLGPMESSALSFRKR
jgi:hypothetical protein